MKMRNAIKVYVMHKQALGIEFTDRASQLRLFCDAVGNVDLDRIQPKAVLGFLNDSKRSAVSRGRYRATLAAFFRFAVVRGHAAGSPIPTDTKYPSSPFAPYIYSPEELRRLLDGTRASQSHGACRIQHRTLRALLLLLYGCGLRISEALRMCMSDMDLTEQVLVIRQTKFGKSRLVPIGPQLTRVLRLYIRHDRSEPRQSGPTAPLFTTLQGASIDVHLADYTFRRLCREVGIHRVGGYYQPRLHDLRHTFVVHRLLSWYRRGQDVQALLPHLSTYLGHLNLTGTQHYLSFTPELASAAASRFEHYATWPEHSHESKRSFGAVGPTVPRRIFGPRTQSVRQHPTQLPRRTSTGAALYGKRGA